MKVAFVASEAIPYAKTGGLADVVGTLPVYLDKIGCETAILMPKYKGIDATYYKDVHTQVGPDTYVVKIYRKNNAYFIDYPLFYERTGLYGSPEGDYSDNCERFVLFCKAAVELIKDLGFDMVHCHDWQTGLIPLYAMIAELKAHTVFTIHNLGYQGKFPAAKFPLLGLDRSFFTPETLEFYGDMNFLKAGILYCDAITTVSRTYAQEIQTAEFGFGLEGVLQKRSKEIFGIMNGIDYNIWNPKTDKYIYSTYEDYPGKLINKKELAYECNLDGQRPLIGMVSRVAGQKGFDLLSKTLDEMIWMGFNFILLGFGESLYHDKMKKFEEIFPGRVSINLKFDEMLAHRIYAASDFFLMPSKYEPCGLGQLISLKYGSVPIVHKTGGLADTVSNFDAVTKTGNGFVFTGYSGKELLSATEAAYEIYCMPDLFKELSENCMKYDFSWDKSAQEYKRLYDRLMSK